jgi:NADPH2:quinone reductase
LVIGGASAVGHYITQLVVLAGGKVIATIGSTAKAAHAQDAGTHHVVNYKTEPVAERIKQLTHGAGVDVIIDMDLSTTTHLLTQGCLKPHGLLVCYGSNVPGDVPINFRSLLYASIGLKFFLVYDLTEEARAFGLQRFDALLHANSLKHTIGATLPLKDLVKAHQMVETGQVLGNVVIQI